MQLHKLVLFKLVQHGIEKVIPDSQALTAAYRRAVFLQRIEAAVNELRDEIAEQSIEVPGKLASMVHKELDAQPELPWDQAIWRLARRQEE